MLVKVRERQNPAFEGSKEGVSECCCLILALKPIFNEPGNYPGNSMPEAPKIGSKRAEKPAKCSKLKLKV